MPLVLKTPEILDSVDVVVEEVVVVVEVEFPDEDTAGFKPPPPKT
jgi:hypothetical protein